MKRKTTILKSLLVAAGLLAGASGAWAQTVAFEQDFTANAESSTNPTDYGFTITYGNGSSSTLINYTVEDGVLKCAAGPYSNASDGARTGTATATFDAIPAGNEVNLSYTWSLGAATGNASGSYTKTSIGNASGNALIIEFYGSSGDGTLKVNGATIKSGNSSIRYTTYTVSATLNMNTKKVTALTLTNSNSSFSYTASETIDFASAITSVDRFVFENSERQNWTNTSSIDNVSVTYTDARESVETIVVNYTYNNETIASENIGTAGLYTGDVRTIPFRMYIEKDGALYKAAASGTNGYYRDNITLTTNTVVNKVVTPVDLNGGTIILMEDLDDADGENASIRASYGSAYNNKAYTSATKLPAGIYTFIVKALSKGRTSSIKVGNQQLFTIHDIVGDNKSGTENKGAWTDKTFTDIEIPAAGYLSLAKGSDGTIDCYDIIIAIKTAECADQTVTANAAGYQTYSSSYDLDFTSTDTKAYIATAATGGTVTLTKVTKVPAGTGLFLKTAANEGIPVLATDADDVSSNLLKPTTGEDIYNVEKFQYVFAKQNDELGFYKVTGSLAPAAGKAYLETAAALAARLAITLDDDTDVTGIESVAALPATAEGYYNLQGQRVSTPQKGLYIVNGKKVIIK